MEEKLRFEFSNDPVVVGQILDLQALNLRQNLSSTEAKEQGFVYVHHKKEALQAVCDTEPAVVALTDHELAGYAICMDKKFKDQVPELQRLLTLIDSLLPQWVHLEEPSYLICGQVCVNKNFRGLGLMSRLYDKMKELNGKYQFCVTEISSQNTRSLHAHAKVGFKIIHTYIKQDEEWNIVLWDWNNLNPNKSDL